MGDHLNGVIIHRLDRFNFPTRVLLLTALGVLAHPEEAVDHIFGSHFRSIVEFNSLLEVEHPSILIRRFPLCGEVGDITTFLEAIPAKVAVDFAPQTV